jgi:tripartite-type tricarboxylate transporter receptor subunit TctC
VDEAGLPGFYVANWTAFFAPKGTPANVIARLNEATVSTLADPTTRQKLADLGFEIPEREQLTPAALAPSIKPKSRSGGRSSRRRTSGE